MAGNIVYLNDDNFDQEVAKGTILVDLYADWCGPCRMIAPIMEELSKATAGKYRVGKLDIDASQQTTSKLGVTSIPTVIVFKDGQEESRVVGVKSLEDFKKLVEKSL